MQEEVVSIVKLAVPEGFKVTPETKKELHKYYKAWKAIANQQTIKLGEIQSLEGVYIIVTKGLVVIDFDTNQSFEEALIYDSHLQSRYRCQYIVKSLRKGGHFYYKQSKETITLPLQHTKQEVLDILVGPGHNVLAATKAETGKEVIYQGDQLSHYNEAINTLITNIVIKALPMATRAIALTPLARTSDNAVNLIKAYLANIITQRQFNEFYTLPDPIPPHQSNEVYQRLSTRLASDLTIDQADYIVTMEKYNQYTQRKSKEELHKSHLQRMLQNSNGLWRYDEDALKVSTYSTVHKHNKTPIVVYFDEATGEYLVVYKNFEAQQKLHILKGPAPYLELMEKISPVRKEQLRRATAQVSTVTTHKVYSKDFGYNAQDRSFNTAIHNRYLQAFNGAKPTDYTTPDEFLQLLEYMWGDEYEYMLGATKYRYSTFTYTPVITNIVGEEGTGKDLSIYILAAGFSEPPQALDYNLMKDKHSNWQTKENVVFSEVGEWRFSEQDDMLERLKTISGSNGVVTYRGMQQSATTVQSIIKIWVTGNNWVKLHTDINSSRRIHTLYMPNPLEKFRGGPYTKGDIDGFIGSLLNFYYWLGNECIQSITLEEYTSAYSRQHTQSYQTYIEATSDKSDTASNMIYKEQTYSTYKGMLEIFQLVPDDVEFRYLRTGDYVVNLKSLKDVVKRSGASYIVGKTLDNIIARSNNGKRVLFDTGKQKYLTIAGAPPEISSLQI